MSIAVGSLSLANASRGDSSMKDRSALILMTEALWRLIVCLLQQLHRLRATVIQRFWAIGRC